MNDYCTCGRRRFDREFRLRGFVRCPNCRKPISCDAVSGDGTAKPHPAEIAQNEQFLCWNHHWNVISSMNMSNPALSKVNPSGLSKKTVKRSGSHRLNQTAGR